MFFQKRKAFTLVELLIVVSIMGILIALVLVSLSGARKKSRETKIITAINQYKLQLEYDVDEKTQDYNSAAMTTAISQSPYTKYKADIIANGGISSGGTTWGETLPAANPSLKRAKAQYRIWVVLPTGNKYCLDSIGIEYKGTNTPSSTTYTCPIL